MVEEQVQVEILVADLEVILAADKGETLAEFEEEFPQVIEQAPLELPLRDVRRGCRVLWIVRRGFRSYQSVGVFEVHETVFWMMRNGLQDRASLP